MRYIIVIAAMVVGMTVPAAADLALAQIVYNRAKKEGRGMEIEIPAPGTQ